MESDSKSNFQHIFWYACAYILLSRIDSCVLYSDSDIRTTKEELYVRQYYDFINIPCIIPKAVPPSSSNLAQICKFILSLPPL